MDSKIERAIDKIKASQSIDELKDIFINLGSLMAHSEVIAAKNKRKEELQNASN